MLHEKQVAPFTAVADVNLGKTVSN